MTTMIDRRTAWLCALADEIARDRGTAPAGYAEWAWAVQHVNEAVKGRNAFKGLTGMTDEDAERGLADYRKDRKLWNVREYEAELAAGTIRCVSFTGHSTLPSGTIIHRNAAWLVAKWREAGKVLADYAPADCPEGCSR